MSAIGSVVTWLWVSLQFAIVFGVTFWALGWFAERALRRDQTRVAAAVYVLVLAVAVFTAYAVVIDPPLESDCIEASPQGTGRC